MIAVDLRFLLTCQLTKQRGGPNRDRVRFVAIRRVLRVLDSAVNLGTDILPQRSTQEHVEDLDAETDRQQWLSILEYGFKQIQIGLITPRHDGCQVRVRLFSVEVRIDVTIAAGDNDSIQILRQFP